MANKILHLFICLKTVDCINIRFLKTILLQNQQNLFETTGKGMRHLKIKTVKEIFDKQIVA